MSAHVPSHFTKATVHRDLLRSGIPDGDALSIEKSISVKSENSDAISQLRSCQLRSMGFRVLALLVAFLATVAPSPDWLRPTYHFTRAANEMNDPNGLMYTTAPDGTVSYHMYFQSSDPGQPLGSIWGHATSPDLVRWLRQPRTGIRGSSGGGVVLPSDFVPPTQLSGARAVSMSSVPLSPSRNPPTGLHLWYSTDQQLLNWTEYRNSSAVQRTSCVICPSDVPSEFRAGYIGDNYMWTERSASNGQYTFFVLSGSTRCATAHPWCSCTRIGGNSSAQAFVFESKDLLNWQLISNWDFLPKQDAWPAGFPHSWPSQWPAQRIDTPDTFAVYDQDTGSQAQAFVWLNSPGCHTHWMVGQMNSTTKSLTPSTFIGCADKGDMFCQQSLDTQTAHKQHTNSGSR